MYWQTILNCCGRSWWLFMLKAAGRATFVGDEAESSSMKSLTLSSSDSASTSASTSCSPSSSGSWPARGSLRQRALIRREHVVCCRLTPAHRITRRLVRTSCMLALACCYLMWMVTYMVQLHPLLCKSSIIFILLSLSCLNPCTHL